MSTALRVFVVVPISLIFFASAGMAYAQEGDTDANEACPKQDFYVYRSDLPLNATTPDGKVNLYGKTCQKIDDATTLVRGTCTAPQVCKGEEYLGLDKQWHKLSGDKTELQKLKVEDVRKALESGTPQTPLPLSSPSTPGSLLDQWMLNPTPIDKQKIELSSSANSLGELLKQSDAEPGFVDKARASISNFFFPQKSVNDLVPLEGGQLSGEEQPQQVQTTRETGVGVTGFGQPQEPQMPIADASSCDGWMSCMREKISTLFDPTSLEEAKARRLESNWNFGNMKSCRGGVCTGYQSFATPEDGARADINNIAKWVDRGDDTLNKLMNRLSPPSDGNDTRGMVNYLSNKLGIAPNTRLDLSNETQIVNLFNEKAFLEHSVRATDVMSSRDIIGAYQSMAQAYGIADDSEPASQVPLPQPNPLVGGSSSSYGPREASGFNNEAAYNYFSGDNAAAWASVKENDVVYAPLTGNDYVLGGNAAEWASIKDNDVAYTPLAQSDYLSGDNAAALAEIARNENLASNSYFSGENAAAWADVARNENLAGNEYFSGDNAKAWRAVTLNDQLATNKYLSGDDTASWAEVAQDERTVVAQQERDARLAEVIRSDQAAYDAAKAQEDADAAARQQILNDQNSALEDRKALADEQAAAYQKSLKDAESQVPLPDTVAVDAQKSVEEANAAERQAALEEKARNDIDTAANDAERRAALAEYDKQKAAAEEVAEVFPSLSDGPVAQQEGGNERIPMLTDAQVEEKVRSAFDQKIKDAQGTVRYAEELLARSESPAARELAQAGLDDARKRLDAIVEGSISYNAGNPSPELQKVIERIQTGDDAGFFSRGLTALADTAHSGAKVIGDNLPTSADITEPSAIWKVPAMVVGGGIWGIASGVGLVAESGRNLLEKLDVVGFRADTDRELSAAIDPIGTEFKTAADVAVVAPFGVGLAKSAIGAGVDAGIEASASVTRGVTKGIWGDVAQSDARITVRDSAGFVTNVERGALVIEDTNAARTIVETARPVSPAEIAESSLPKAANIDSVGDVFAPTSRNIDDALAKFDGAANDLKSVGNGELAAPPARTTPPPSDNPFLQGTDRITSRAIGEAEVSGPASSNAAKDAIAEIDRIAAESRAAAEASVPEIKPALEIPTNPGVLDYVPTYADKIRLAWNDTWDKASGVVSDARNALPEWFGGTKGVVEKSRLELVVDNPNPISRPIEPPTRIAEEIPERIAVGENSSPVPLEETVAGRRAALRDVNADRPASPEPTAKPVEPEPVATPEPTIATPDNLAALRQALAEDAALQERIAADAARQAENVPPNWAHNPDGLPEPGPVGSLTSTWAEVNATLAKPKVAEAAPEPVVAAPRVTERPTVVLADEAQIDNPITRAVPDTGNVPAAAEKPWYERWYEGVLRKKEPLPLAEKPALPDTATRNPVDVLGDEGPVPVRTPAQGDFVATRTEPPGGPSPELTASRAEPLPSELADPVKVPSKVEPVTSDAPYSVSNASRPVPVSEQPSLWERWFGKSEPAKPVETVKTPTQSELDALTAGDQGLLIEPRVKNGLPDTTTRDPFAAAGDEGPLIEAIPTAKAWDNPTLTRNEFISDYKARYPNTTLSDAELAARFRDGQRLNPETGRLMVPEVPAPTVAESPSLLKNPLSWVKENPIKSVIAAPFVVAGIGAGWEAGKGIGYLFGGGGGGTPPPPPLSDGGGKPPAGAVVPDKEVKDKVPPPVPPPGTRQPYDPRTVTPPFVNATPNPNGPILDRDYYCITSINPVMVVPLAAGSRFPSNCYNSYAGNPNSNPFANLGQLLGRLFGTSAPTSAQPTQPTRPPITPPTTTTPTPPKPFATLIANPTTVSQGGKSRLIWSSVNTSRCELFAPGNIAMATGTRGSTSTQALATTTQFTLNCSAPSGATTSAQATVTVQ